MMPPISSRVTGAPASPSTQQMPLQASRSQQNCSVMMSDETSIFSMSSIIFLFCFLMIISVCYVCSPTDYTLLAVCSPTESTEYTEPSCCMFSHGIHGIHRTFLLYVLPQIAQIFTDVAFRGCTCLKCTNPFCCCTSCSVGALETSAPPERTYLCRSVKSVGEYFQQPLP